MENIKVIMAPTRELAEECLQKNRVIATVEAEYGDYCIEGEKVTLAHHGIRSDNPAPCNTKDIPVLSEGVILISHLDLDTVGGVLALTGQKIDDPEFWAGVEYIDVLGAHHIHELHQEVQDKLNAVYAWNSEHPRKRNTEITDVTEIINSNATMLAAVLNERHPEHETMIQKGREWEKEINEKVNSKLECEWRYSRNFITDGVFCSSSYYSHAQGIIMPATVTLNTKYNAITIAFEDGGRKASAKELVQKLWGPEAGGRDGIAGSPRGWQKSPEEALEEYHRACDAVEAVMEDEYNKILPISADQTPQEIMEALDRDPSSIVNILYGEDFENAKHYLATGEIPGEWKQEIENGHKNTEMEYEEEDIER